MTALYATQARAVGGRAGHVETQDGLLSLDLALPREMGGKGGGTNPEQLFAAGWSACFEGAMAIAARKRKIILPQDTAIDAEVDLGMAGDGYLLQARLHVSLPGLPSDVAQALVDEAHRTCPYSKATQGNIDVTIDLA